MSYLIDSHRIGVVGVKRQTQSERGRGKAGLRRVSLLLMLSDERGTEGGKEWQRR